MRCSSQTGFPPEYKHIHACASDLQLARLKFDASLGIPPGQHQTKYTQFLDSNGCAMSIKVSLPCASKGPKRPAGNSRSLTLVPRQPCLSSISRVECAVLAAVRIGTLCTYGLTSNQWFVLCVCGLFFRCLRHLLAPVCAEKDTPHAELKEGSFMQPHSTAAKQRRAVQCYIQNGCNPLYPGVRTHESPGRRN